MSSVYLLRCHYISVYLVSSSVFSSKFIKNRHFIFSFICSIWTKEQGKKLLINELSNIKCSNLQLLFIGTFK